MSETYIFPAPPSVNRYFKTNRQGHVYQSQEARDYKELIGWECRRLGLEPLRGDVCANLVWFRARRSGDLTNLFKVGFDAFEGHMYENDKQIAELHAWRFEDKDNPRIELSIEPLDNKHLRLYT